MRSGAPVVLLGAAAAPSASPPRSSRARRGTINYEITCGMSQRLPRVYVG